MPFLSRCTLETPEICQQDATCTPVSPYVWRKFIPERRIGDTTGITQFYPSSTRKPNPSLLSAAQRHRLFVVTHCAHPRRKRSNNIASYIPILL